MKGVKTCVKIALFVLLIVAASCASRKKTIVPAQPQSFEWLTAKLALQAEGNKLSYDDFSGQLRMRKDSLVWINLTATMGVEVARIKMSNDSVWVINRMDKTYLAEPLDAVSAWLGMPLSLPLVQSLLLDNNEGIPPHEDQTLQLKNFALGNYSAKVRYSNVILDEATNFPIKITDKMKRLQLPNMP